MNTKLLFSLTLLTALAIQPAQAVTKQQKKIAAAITMVSLAGATGYWLYSQCSAPVLYDIDSLPKKQPACILTNTINKIQEILEKPQYYSDNFTAVNQDNSQKTLALDTLLSTFYKNYDKKNQLLETDMLNQLKTKAIELNKSKTVIDEIQLQITIAQQL